MLRSYGIPVPDFKVSSKATGIGKAAYELSPGPFVCKCQVHSGARGKADSNDADAEYVATIRRIMDEGGVHFQTAELGKVDAGGGGTIAYILATYGMNVIDCGVPVLSMHAPWEATSKADIYEAYRGYREFLKLA